MGEDDKTKRPKPGDTKIRKGENLKESHDSGRAIKAGKVPKTPKKGN